MTSTADAMKNVNEIFFRQALRLRNQPEYIDDLDAGAPLESVARDYVANCAQKAIEALICARGGWYVCDADTAERSLKPSDLYGIVGEIGDIVRSELGRYTGTVHRPIDEEDE